MRITLGAAILFIVAVVGSASAQWLSLPLPGTPRTPDGKPNLTAAVLRTSDGKPDLSGIWKVDDPRWNNNLLPEGVEAPMLPWAAEIYKHRMDTRGFERPPVFCMPHGTPDAVTAPLPFKILQTPAVTTVLFEEFHKYRQVHTDGRALPVDPQPAWVGYSVGSWDGDTFVIRTSGFNDRSWLDAGGTPHTEALKTTERMKRIDFGHMQIEFTFDDPKTFTKPWSATVKFNLLPDTDLLEFHCDNEKWSEKPR